MYSVSNLLFSQELLAPLYFMLIIILVQLGIPEPSFPTVTSEEVRKIEAIEMIFYLIFFFPQGKADLFSAAPFLFTNQSSIIAIPDDADTKEFIDFVKQSQGFLGNVSF